MILLLLLLLFLAKEISLFFRYIAILSGLTLNGSDASRMGPLDLAISWLTGEAGDMADQEKMSRVCRVIEAGNCLAQETRDNDDRQAKYLTKNKEATSIDAINALDDILAQLADTVEVDLMPGANDPANQSLPQQPLHKCLFPSEFSATKLIPPQSFF